MKSKYGLLILLQTLITNVIMVNGQDTLPKPVFTIDMGGGLSLQYKNDKNRMGYITHGFLNNAARVHTTIQFPLARRSTFVLGTSVIGIDNSVKDITMSNVLTIYNLQHSYSHYLTTFNNINQVNNSSNGEQAADQKIDIVNQQVYLNVNAGFGFYSKRKNAFELGLGFQKIIYNKTSINDYKNQIYSLSISERLSRMSINYFMQYKYRLNPKWSVGLFVQGDLIPIVNFRPRSPIETGSDYFGLSFIYHSRDYNFKKRKPKTAPSIRISNLKGYDSYIMLELMGTGLGISLNYQGIYHIDENVHLGLRFGFGLPQGIPLGGSVMFGKKHCVELGVGANYTTFLRYGSLILAGPCFGYAKIKPRRIFKFLITPMAKISRGDDMFFYMGMSWAWKIGR